MNRVSACFLAGMLLSATPVHAVVITVGAAGDPDCDHATLALAVAAASANGIGSDEIRVAGNQSYNGISQPFVGHSLHIRGGYSSCGDTTPSGQTTLRGAAGANASLRTSGTTGFSTLILEDLALVDGNGNPRNGGALAIDGAWIVELRNVRIANNVAALGGGVHVDGSAGATLVVTGDSLVDDNIARVGGGGIYCRDGGSVLLVSGTIRDNLAEDGGADPLVSGNGGGIALFDCSASQAAQPGVRGVIGNDAQRDGGGYYLRGGATLTLQGDATSPALLTTNRAGNAGGGLAVNDPLPLVPATTSTVFVYDSWIDTNRANRGGGIALLAGGDVQMRRLLDDADCHDTPVCSSLSYNDKDTGDTSCLGAAAFVGEGGRLRLYNTYVEENCPGGAGWTFRQTRDSRVEIDSSIVAHNGGASSPFFLDGNGGFTGLLQLAWSTVTGHYATVRSSMFTVPTDSAFNTGTLRVYGSLLGEPFLALADVGGPGPFPPMTLQFDCLLADNAYAGSTFGGRVIRAPAPWGMLDPAAGSYRPGGASAAMVDLCDASLGERADGDVLGLDGSFDASRANLFGPRDVGAFEFRGSGTIFTDGFEGAG